MVSMMILGIVALLFGLFFILDAIYSNSRDKFAKEHGIISNEKYYWFRIINNSGFPMGVLTFIFGILLLVITPFNARDTYIGNYLKGKYEVTKSVKFVEKDGVLMPKDSTYLVKPLPKSTKVVTIKVPATTQTQESEVDGV